MIPSYTSSGDPFKFGHMTQLRLMGAVDMFPCSTTVRVIFRTPIISLLVVAFSVTTVVLSSKLFWSLYEEMEFMALRAGIGLPWPSGNKDIHGLLLWGKQCPT